MEWFSKIENKERLSFIQYDVDNLYATITEELINKSLDYASNYVEISDDDRRIILQSKKSFLFDKNQPWCKKGDTNFDVGMGSFDGAKTCELVCLFIFHLLTQLNLNQGIYRNSRRKKSVGFLKKTTYQSQL